MLLRGVADSPIRLRVGVDSSTFLRTVSASMGGRGDWAMRGSGEDSGSNSGRVVAMTAAQESQNISLSPLAPVERHIDSVNSSRADDRTSKSQTGTSSRLGKTLTPDTDPGFDHDGASDGDDGEDVFGNLSRELHAQVVVTAPSEDDIWVNAGRDSVVSIIGATFWEEHRRLTGRKE